MTDVYSVFGGGEPPACDPWFRRKWVCSAASVLVLFLLTCSFLRLLGVAYWSQDTLQLSDHPPGGALWRPLLLRWRMFPPPFPRAVAVNFHSPSGLVCSLGLLLLYLVKTSSHFKTAKLHPMVFREWRNSPERIRSITNSKHERKSFSIFWFVFLSSYHFYCVFDE